MARKKPDRDGDQLDRRRGVYMISVAAELAGMHPQTLRIYETRGLIKASNSFLNSSRALVGSARNRRLRRW